jgi:hypothetical protein
VRTGGGLRPFFSYYGSKWSLGRHYSAPAHDTIVEPLAGSAGYGLFHHKRRVVLIDSDEAVAGLWQYLIRVSAAEIMALPAGAECVDDVPGPQEARWLVGFWLGRATAFPRRSLSKWGRTRRWPTSFWGEYIRDRIASQVDSIRHWTARCGSFETCDDISATWFVDPPYERQGRFYRSGPIDRAALADWCRARRGQVIVCENEGADWLPFEPFRTARANSSRGKGRTSREVVWQQERAA